jgi:hypothetical protein
MKMSLSYGNEIEIITFERWIEKKEEQTYLEVPFDMGHDIEALEIQYEYTDKGNGAVIDIGLRSPQRIVGWSGGARSSFLVGEEKATPGYLASHMMLGTWFVLLGAYRIPEHGCCVKILIKMKKKHQRWVTGDLHMHSVHSDGSYTLPEVISIGREKEFSFMAFTDHNTASQNFEVMRDEHLLIIPGVELTSYKGHANLFGVRDALEDFRVLTPEQVSSQLQKAKEKGAFISLNHPFCSHCPWEFGFEVPYDAIEVWNGPWRDINEVALQWWHEQLCSGKKIVALGGSDTHRPEPFVQHGRPTSHILVDSDVVEDILIGMKKGHVILSYDYDGTFIEAECGGNRIGDTVLTEQEELVIDIKVRNAKGDCIRVISNQGVEGEWTVDSEANLSFSGKADRLFYRFESTRYFPEVEQVLVTCLTNPIYLWSDMEENGNC